VRSAVLLVLLAGCMSAIDLNRGELLTRASFDLSCPRRELAVQDLGGRTAGVSGCGQRASYVWNDKVQVWQR
jgi:hypothetical protein